MKTFFGLRDMEEFYTKYMPTLDYKSDGVIFTPVNEPIRSGCVRFFRNNNQSFFFHSSAAAEPTRPSSSGSRAK
jgi:hypothetical protein